MQSGHLVKEALIDRLGLVAYMTSGRNTDRHGRDADDQDLALVQQLREYKLQVAPIIVPILVITLARRMAVSQDTQLTESGFQHGYARARDQLYTFATPLVESPESILDTAVALDRLNRHQAIQATHTIDTLLRNHELATIIGYYRATRLPIFTTSRGKAEFISQGVPTEAIQTIFST